MIVSSDASWAVVFHSGAAKVSPKDHSDRLVADGCPPAALHDAEDLVGGAAVRLGLKTGVPPHDGHMDRRHHLRSVAYDPPAE